MTAPQTVSLDQRHTRSRPCQVCGGYSAQPQGKGVRCAGFRSADDEYEHCQREQYAGDLPLDERTTPPTYAHRMRGDCRCGVTHGPARMGQGTRGMRPTEWNRYPAIVAASGEHVGEHVRKDTYDADGRRLPKEMWWKPKGIQPATLALYHTAALVQEQATGHAVIAIVTEGERKARELNAALLTAGRHDVIAVGTMTGASSTPCDEALRVLLGCKEVWRWPDNDDDGRRHMERIGARLEVLGGDPPKWVEWRAAPPKGDAADYLAAGGTVAGIEAMVSQPQQTPPKQQATPPEPTVRRWPKPLDNAAYYGVLGRIARELEPYIEADSAALLINLVATAGVTIGRGPHVRVGAKMHYPCLYDVNVGGTGDNKGDGWWPIDSMLEQVTATAEAGGLPLRPQTWGGMSTGEGLLWQVRDERREMRQSRKGEPAEEVIADAGVTDKRLLAFEPEFARVLAVMYREGNTLSMVLRDLYDGASVARSSPKANPIIASGAHFGMIGQITPEELGRKLQEVELFNGFANRFLWVLTKRLHSRPNPPAYTAEAAAEHAKAWCAAIAKARAVGEIKRDEQAAHVWEQIYETLRTGMRDGQQTRSGMALEVCARAHVHVLRSALTFAALDGSTFITRAHQEAALAIWDYAEASAMYLFGHVSGDPVTEVIHAALAARGPLSRTDISRLFSRHMDAGTIQTALDALLASGRARMWKEPTSGGPREMWEAVSPASGDAA